MELKDIQNALLDVDLEAGDPLLESQDTVEKAIFECSLTIKKRLRATTVASPSATPSSSAAGAKLPKLEVPTFNGDVLNRQGFWEQFCVSVHDRSNLMNAEKLVYLRNANKDSTAKRTIEGLTKSGEHYEEAVKCLKSRYDRPRLIHQAHLRRILEAPTLKHGSGKELRLLHDLVLQHLRALKAMGHEPSNAFITSMLELKLDITTMFEWHRHTQDHTDVPDCHELLEFLNLRAQAAEASSSSERKPRGGPPAHFNSSRKPVTAFVSNTLPVDANCIACKVEKHPLYSCSKFKDLAHRDMVALLKSNNCCLNCLRPGHFVKECKSLHHCKRCQKPHHTLLHVETKTDPPPTEPPPAVANHASVKLRPDLLLMTCQVMIETPRGSVKARALLDSASSTSFVSERLAQSHRLQRHPQIARICGIVGLSHGSRAQSLTNFKVSSVHSSSKKFDVNAIVVPQVTCDLPVHPIPPTHDWKHLDGLRLADPDFSKPGRVDLLLGIETFVEVVRQGRRKGGLDTPTAIKTEFGGFWLAARTVPIRAQSYHTMLPCCREMTSYASFGR